MKKNQVQDKLFYHPPMVEVILLYHTLNFLDKSFSNEGYLGEYEDGREFGDAYGDNGSSLKGYDDGGEF